MQTPIKTRYPQGLIVEEISTTDIAQADRFEWWRAQYRPLNEVQIERDHRADFRAAARTWRLGPVLLTHCDAVARQVVRTSADCRRDGVDDWNVRIAADASVTSRSAGGSLRIRPGLATLGTFRSEYCDSYDAGGWGGVIFPRSIAPSIHPDTAAGCIEPLTGAPGLALADYLLSMARLLPSALPHYLPRLADMTRAMLVAALSAPRSPSVDPADRLTLVRARVEQIILANIGSGTRQCVALDALQSLRSDRRCRRLRDGHAARPGMRRYPGGRAFRGIDRADRRPLRAPQRSILQPRVSPAFRLHAEGVPAGRAGGVR